MLTKFSVLKRPSVILKLARCFGLTYYEKAERLRQLCCTSDMERRFQEQESSCAPRLPAPLTPQQAKSICEQYHIHQGIELMDVRCKTALIMGGASSIGAEAAAALIDNGALHVVIADHDRCKAMNVVDKLNAPLCERRAHCLVADVRSNTSYEQAFQEVKRCYRQVDIFVNCVRVYNETPECWESMLDVNLIGTIRGTILAYRCLSQNGGGFLPRGGVILNVVSLGSLVKMPTMPFYAAAAAGIRGLTSSFGHEFHYEKSCVRFLTLCTASPPVSSSCGMAQLQYDPKWALNTQEIFKSSTPAKLVGRSICHMIKHASNGSVFVVKDKKLYKYFIPNYKHVMSEETVLY